MLEIEDQKLLEATKKLAVEERKISTQVITHLIEVNRRKLFSDLRYESLFQYCVKELKYSEAAASRRVSAAQIVSCHPETQDKIRSGELNFGLLADINALAKANELNQNETKSLIELAAGKSQNEFKAKMADLNGRPESPLTRPIKLPTHYLKFKLTKQTQERFEKLHDKLVARGASSKERAFEMMLQLAEEKLREKDNAIKCRNTSPVRVLKTLTPKMRREVMSRDKGVCVKCGSQFQLEIDHLVARAMGGENSLNNLRCLCRSCNQREAIKMFGVRSY